MQVINQNIVTDIIVVCDDIFVFILILRSNISLRSIP